jgi:hypothetical protein
LAVADDDPGEAGLPGLQGKDRREAWVLPRRRRGRPSVGEVPLVLRARRRLVAASGVKRVRIHVPAKDGWPESVRGVGSRIDCPTCGESFKAKSHAKVRAALALHRQEQHE